MQRTKPKVDGPQIARVVGPKGEEIFTDNFGRIRLQFLWDRESQGDDLSSCWIRVTQPWAGQGWGVLAIPRVGQEVLVDFLDGDPDQPIVTGRTYNAQQLPPGNLPQSKTQMAFRSKTYKGEGYNELLFEDAPGREQLNLHAQRDMNVVVLKDKSTTVMGNSSETIAENHHLEIHQNYQKTVNDTENQRIGENLIERINGDYTLSSLETLLSSAEGDIVFETAGGKITITQDGQILALAKKIIINGEVVKINCGQSPQTVDVGELLNQPQKKKPWLAFQYFDSNLQPLPHLKYTSTFETGEKRNGQLDGNGYVYIDNPPSDIIQLEIGKNTQVKRESMFNYLDKMLIKGVNNVGR
ncbi:MAG: type VI secretion system tip protein TssI/VgrG [Lonepinella koalarum]|nr:type VI secretion system tip protein TssI/VgrG [Lonepinella koalarum]